MGPADRHLPRGQHAISGRGRLRHQPDGGRGFAAEHGIDLAAELRGAARAARRRCGRDRHAACAARGAGAGSRRGRQAGVLRETPGTDARPAPSECSTPAPRQGACSASVTSAATSPRSRRCAGSSRAARSAALLLLDANFSHNLFRSIDPANWRLSRENAPAGAMTALGIHLTDMFVSLAGVPVRVAARTATLMFTPPARGFRHGRDRFRERHARPPHLPLVGPVLRPLYRDRRPRLGGGAGGRKCRPGPAVDARAGGQGRGAHEPKRSSATDTVRKNFEAWADAVEGRSPIASRRINFSPMFACWKRSCAPPTRTAPRWIALTACAA